MRGRRLFWLLFPACLALCGVTLLACGTLASWHYRRALLARTTADLETQARELASLLAGRPAAARAADADSLCKALGRGVPARLTVVAADGTVLGDSDEDPRAMASHRDRPEIAAALAGRVGAAARASPTQARRLLYVAVPVLGDDAGGAVTGAARAALPLVSLDEPLRALDRRLAPLWLLAAVLSAGTAALLTRRLAQPLAELRRGVDAFAAGGLQERLRPPGPAEVDELAAALNAMAGTLDARLRATVRQRGEQEAVLASMMEGVLAVDDRQQLIEINAAAARLLGTSAARALGRSLAEVARNAELHRFVAAVLEARAPREGEIVFEDAAPGGGERVMQAHGTRLRDEAGREFGVLVVLNDVTRLRRLETVRREFVANVSHELKTPITAIKGFVETIVEGGAADRDETLRFLGIVARQAERLNAIIEDLLVLSRLEQDQERGGFAPDEARVAPVLAAAVQACGPSADARGVPVGIDCPADLAARIDPALLEQAVVNLVDNAVKFSEPGRPVRVTAERTAAGLEIRVRDRGCGIAREHLPRLCERFYRVDKGRSRNQGGTGLGLAIVKHIVKVHGGGVRVESEPGEGSTFTICIP